MTETGRIASIYDEERPRKFGDMCGLESEIEQIKRGITSPEPPNVYLISGGTGSGKTTLAKIIARSKLCKQRKVNDAEPCGQCYSCTRRLDYHVWSHSDYFEYDGNDLQSDNLSVEMTNEFLRERMVLFIDEIQEASKGSQVAFLKAIEILSATLIVSTTHPEQLNDALMNRLKVFEYKLKRPSVDEVVGFLEKSFQKHGVTFQSHEQLRRIAVGYHCEMRPCSQFAGTTRARVGTVLTDEFLDEMFGRGPEQEGGGVSSSSKPTGVKARRKAI